MRKTALTYIKRIKAGVPIDILHLEQIVCFESFTATKFYEFAWIQKTCT